MNQIEEIAKASCWRAFRERLEKSLCAKAPFDSFKAALDIYDLLVRLVAAPSVYMCLQYDGALLDSPDFVAFHQEFRDRLGRPTVGDWVSITGRSRKCLTHLDSAHRVLRGILDTKITVPTFPELAKRISTVTGSSGSNKTVFQIVDILRELVPLRNKAYGHATLSDKFYAATSKLLLDTLGPVSSSLESLLIGEVIICRGVHLISNDTVRCTGEIVTGTLKKPWQEECELDAHLEENQVYFVSSAGQATKLSFGPFLLPSEHSDDILFFDEFSEDRARYFGYGIDEPVRLSSPKLTNLFAPPDHPAKPLATRIKTAIQCAGGVTYNLPRPDYYKYVERVGLQEKALLALGNPRIFIVTLDGIGGSGKSALALHLAQMLVERRVKLESFKPDFVVWFSAKNTYLTPSGIVKTTPQGTTLAELLAEILRVAEFEYQEAWPLEKLKAEALETLRLAGFLVIIDNLETVEDVGELWSFLLDPALSQRVKFVVTTRHRQAIAEFPLKVEPLSREQVLELIQSESERLSITLTPTEAGFIYERTGGIPLAVKHVMSQFAGGLKLDQVLQRGLAREGDILEFCFPNTFALVSPQAKRALFALALWGQPMTVDDLRHVADFDASECEIAVVSLKKVSFLESKDNSYGDDIFSLLPLTRQYALSEVQKVPAVEEEILKRVAELRALQLQVSGITGVVTTAAIASPSKMLQMAFQCSTRGEIDKAKYWFGQVVKASPGDPFAWIEKAKFEARDLNDISLCRESIRKGLDLKKEPLLLIQCGHIERSSGSPELAVDHFRSALQVEPANKYARHGLGLTLLEEGGRVKDVGKKKSDQATIRAGQQKIRDAAKELREAFFISPSSEQEEHHNCVNGIVLSRALSRLGNQDEAMKIALEAQKLRPRNRHATEWIRKLQEWREQGA
jgi:tetratricopeptide (TPR) repeat protein